MRFPAFNYSMAEDYQYQGEAIALIEPSKIDATKIDTS